MSGNNETILRKGLQEFRTRQYDILEKKLVKYCEKLLTKAIDARLYNTSSSSERGHNFTGNLINSIIVGLFREGKLVMFVTPGPDQGIERPIRKKMTYPFSYYFSDDRKKSKYGQDYDQARSSFYEPELRTNLVYGNADAKRFIRSYQPSSNAVFQIVVGYTTEYASFVEAKRHTTGYLETVEWINMSTRELVV